MLLPKVIQFTENFFFFDVAARVAAKRSLAHAAGEAAHMPAQVVHLKQRQEKLVQVNLVVYARKTRASKSQQQQQKIKIIIAHKTIWQCVYL